MALSLALYGAFSLRSCQKFDALRETVFIDFF